MADSLSDTLFLHIAKRRGKVQISSIEPRIRVKMSSLISKSIALTKLSNAVSADVSRKSSINKSGAVKKSASSILPTFLPIEILFLAYGIHYLQNWNIAILFPALMPVIITLVLSKTKHSVKIAVSIASMLSLLVIQNVFAYFWGDSGSLVGMIMFSFVFTFIPFLVYIFITILLYNKKQKT
mgnify:CR=1 FL=1